MRRDWRRRAPHRPGRAARRFRSCAAPRCDRGPAAVEPERPPRRRATAALAPCRRARPRGGGRYVSRAISTWRRPGLSAPMEDPMMTPVRSSIQTPVARARGCARVWLGRGRVDGDESDLVRRVVTSGAAAIAIKPSSSSSSSSLSAASSCRSEGARLSRLRRRWFRDGRCRW